MSWRVSELALKSPVTASAWGTSEQLYTGHADGALVLRDSDGEVLARIDGAHGGATVTAIAADAAGVVSAGGDFTLILRGLDLAPKGVLAGPSSRLATRIALSSTRVGAVFAPPTPLIGLWDRPTRAGLAVGRGHKGFGTGLAFAPGGALVSSDSHDQLHVWTELLRDFSAIEGKSKGFENFVRAVHAPDDDTIVAASRARWIRRIDRDSGRTTHLLENTPGRGDQVVVSAVGDHVCVVDSFGGIVVFSLADRSVVHSMELARTEWHAVAASPGFARVFLSSATRSVIVETPFV